MHKTARDEDNQRDDGQPGDEIKCAGIQWLDAKAVNKRADNGRNEQLRGDKPKHGKHGDAQVFDVFLESLVSKESGLSMFTSCVLNKNGCMIAD